MSTDKGFEVEQKIVHNDETPARIEGTHASFHFALQKLLDTINSSGSPNSAGGSLEFMLSEEDNPTHKAKFRILLQQIDGQEECPFCAGTGIWGS